MRQNSHEHKSEIANPKMIQDFRDTIEKLKMQELDLADSIHLQDVDPSQLTEKDQEMWDMVEGIIASGTSVEAIMPEFEVYKANINTETSRQFMGYLTNKLTPIRNKEFIARQRKELFE